MASCDTNKFDVDVSNIQIDQPLYRLDKDFFEMDVYQFNAENEQLHKKYGTFYALYVQNMLRLGMIDDPALKYRVEGFLGDPNVQQLYRDVETQFSDLEEEKKKLNQAFRYYSYHVKEKSVPQLVTVISGFDSKVVATDNYLGIGLDMYLGKHSEYYKMMQWPQYKQEMMERERLPYDAMRGWILSEFDHEENGNDLISRIIVYGKGMYAMQAMFPLDSAHNYIGYTSEQLEWCNDNEIQIWSALIESNVLFSSKINDIRQYISEGPFTAGMPKESPGQIGYWVGWMIVKAYMEKHPDMTLEELMVAPVNGQQFLQESKYKPV